MTDVVYVLGRGSYWQDNELRYSLRSLERFITGIGTIYVVGQKPKWLTGVTHLQYPDRHACKERNIMEKMAYCCGHPDLSQQFLHVHDDHTALAPMAATDIPNWAGSTLERLAKGVKKTNHWRDAVINTSEALRARGFKTYNFDLHYPMLFDKTKFLDAMDLYDWKGTKRGFVVKSLYANTLKIPPAVTSDLKILTDNTMGQLVKRLKGRPWFSYGNGGLNGNLKKLLPELYPTPSRFEIIS